jgi:uncharacterized DUF497 family protein
MDELTFEWDEAKNTLNKRKHGIAFEDAKFVFGDPNKVVLPDLLHDEEERWLAIGLVNKVLFVVFTERDENVIRLISARLATNAEKELYNAHNNA